ncbi:MAG: DNA integrity scanning protein DisA nucleotide-binding domain protein [Euryarchaeota archaeon]|nr:DNA integrity scanning protein DisA nucleotide-binding domain protein [Euryarchaeota archaeon]
MSLAYELGSTLIESAAVVAERTGADAILLITNEIRDYEQLRGRTRHKVVLCLTDVNKYFALRTQVPHLVYIGTAFARFGRIRDAILKAVAANHLGHGDNVVCIGDLSPKMRGVDTLTCFNIAKEIPGLSQGLGEISRRVRPEVFEAAIGLALELSRGDENGGPLGTTLVLGDSQSVLKYSKQITLNPFKGYPPESRNIAHMDARPNIRQFAKLDGAFVIERDGIILTAGVLLEAEPRYVNLLPGLGTRHAAAAAITHLTKAIAVVVSASGGTVRIFMDGKIIEEIAPE